MKMRLTCTGTRPLLLHNVRLASPMNPYAKKLKELSAKKAKTDDDRWEIARLEWEGGMYYDEHVGPYLPAENLFVSLIQGARMIKAGLRVERGVVITDTALPLLYAGPRDLDTMWNGGKSHYVYIRPVTVNRNKVDRCRPVFPEWVVEAELLIDPQAIDKDEFIRAAGLAGDFIGLGEFRRVFGRYTTKIEVLDMQPL